MSIRIRLLVALFVVLGVIGVLIKTAVTQAATYYITVNELYQMGPQDEQKETAVSGQILGSSVHWDPVKSVLTFGVDDSAGGHVLPVRFAGDKPNDFSNGWPVIVFGHLDAHGTFQANKLLVKCPSKYNAKGQQTYNAG